MFPDQPTHLNLAANNLSGPVPDSWSQRYSVLYNSAPGGSWASLVLASNPLLCGPLPSWYSGLYPPADIAAWTAGTAIGTTCPLVTTAGAAFTMTITQQPLAQAGTPLTVRVTGNVTAASYAGGWAASMVAPGQATPVSLGSLALLSSSAGSSTWSLDVPGSSLTASGTYTVTVNATGTADTASGSPMAVVVNSADPAPGGSSLQVVAPDARLGASATVTLLLRDAYNNPATLATGAVLNVTGRESRSTLATSANFSKVVEGQFQVVYPLRGQPELLTFSATINGAAVGAASLNVSGVVPTAVDYAATVS
jgi:hypothetical protein